jgi:hypothetical protein
MGLIMLSGFVQVLHINRKHSTKSEHFSSLNKFSMIYLLQKQR